MPPRFTPVPRQWPGATIVCVGAGPSLRVGDLRYASQHGAVLFAVNSAWTICAGTGCPADLLYAPDGKWWRWHQDVPEASLPVYKYTIDPEAVAIRPSVRLLNYRYPDGIDPHPYCVANGGHGGFQLINIAVHAGAARIILLGYDLAAGPHGEHHCHPEHPDMSHPSYPVRRGVYASLIDPLRDRGIVIRNASRHTTIEAIPRVDLEEAFT